MKKTRVTHPAPGRRGKLETHDFSTVAEALAYIERNTQPREHGRPPRIAPKPKGRDRGQK